MSTSTIQWPAEAIWQAVEPMLPGFTVEVLPSIASTSSELMQRARAGRLEPTLLVAEAQTAGRGRLGREWHSGAYAGTGVVPALTFSLGLPLAPRDWSGLSLAVGVSVAESLQPQLPAAGSGRPRVLLKWPNDLWLQDGRKLGGILVETASFSGAAAQPRYVVIGVGLNVLPVLADGLRTPPACLREVDGTLTAPRALERIAAPLVQALLGFAEAGFAPFQARFAQRDLLAGRDVTLSDGSAGQAHGVTENGTLLVHTARGMQAVNSSEISVRPV
ncbi:MAG: biotin--[acetyl-CoA-carboxylase] ligase [Proteobacteria bacterium]|nr:biotin--[acetyl-CoA-carboxylase] ligase [Pseudomonadota bacterium]MBS0493328.1 biotin--[acetyl-CoA-carboxylase] ligase [Pseudomonadota bacterium]